MTVRGKTEVENEFCELLRTLAQLPSKQCPGALSKYYIIVVLSDFIAHYEWPDSNLFPFRMHVRLEFMKIFRPLQLLQLLQYVCKMVVSFELLTGATKLNDSW